MKNLSSITSYLLLVHAPKISRLLCFFMLPLLIAVSGKCQSNTVIVPIPAEIKTGNGVFMINNKTQIVLEGSGVEKIAAYLNDHIKKTYGFSLQIAKAANSNKIVLNYERMDYKFPGAYTLQVNSNGVSIAGDNETGLFYGVQTLIQLLPNSTTNKVPSLQLSIPQVNITDFPRFQYRGMHLDVSRHFFSVEYIKQYIDYLAAYKFNTFHWHLTDDQGWRIEIKKYPKLTGIGSFRNGTITGRYPGTGNDSILYGGYYSQEQIKELVRYAADRYITIIPEIEMPGHSSAAIAAYPQLSCFPGESSAIPPKTTWAGSQNGKQVQQSWGVFEDVLCPTEYTFTFLEAVLDEVMQLFPSPYIHIGGDECPKESWKRSEFCQQLIRDKKLTDEHGLQSYFIQRMEKYINSKGKKIIGWDEILEGGLAPNAAVMSWRGEKGGIAAAKQKHAVVMTPENPLYLNHAQSRQEDSVTQGGFNPLEKVYQYDPLSNELDPTEATYILGAQGNMWSEYLDNEKKLEYMLFPRMIALSEALWSPKAKKNWNNFEKRLPYIFERLDAAGINHSNAYYEPAIRILPVEERDGILLKVNSKKNNGAYYFGNKTKSQFLLYKDSVNARINNSGTYGIRMIDKLDPAIQGEKWGRAYLSGASYLYKTDIQVSFNKATGKKITLAHPPSSNYPGDGAFTLVNGIQNSKGLARSTEFLGFSGSDLEAVIDLGKNDDISLIKLHTLQLEASWIYLPSKVDVSFSNDGINYSGKETLKLTNPNLFEANISSGINTRFIKLIAKNIGIIQTGNPGSGNPAWLFADEIEIH